MTEHDNGVGPFNYMTSREYYRRAESAAAFEEIFYDEEIREGDIYVDYLNYLDRFGQPLLSLNEEVEFYENNGYCASTTLMALFGPDHISVSDRKRLISTSNLLEELHQKAVQSGLLLGLSTSSSGYLGIMNTKGVVGSIIFTKDEEHKTGHVQAAFPFYETMHSTKPTFIIVDISSKDSLIQTDEDGLLRLYASSMFIDPESDTDPEVWKLRNLRMAFFVVEQDNSPILFEGESNLLI